MRRAKQLRGQGIDHKEFPDFGRGHLVELRTGQLRIVRVPAVDHFGFGSFPREEFKDAVLAVVAQLMDVAERNQVKLISAKLAGHALIELWEQSPFVFSLGVLRQGSPITRRKRTARRKLVASPCRD